MKRLQFLRVCPDLSSPRLFMNLCRARSIELLFVRAVCSSVVARLPRPPVSLLGLGRIFRIISVLYSAVVAMSAVSVIWETGRDHVGSSVVIKIAPGSLPSSVEFSVSGVVVVIVL